MGIYLNPKNKGFREAINSEIYVDKTGLIAQTNRYINTEQKFICVSRPRRFGKSMALNMLAAYYSCGCDSRDLFKECKIEKETTFQKHLNQYDVIFLNMQQFLIEAPDDKVTKYLEQEVLCELKEEYKEVLEGVHVGLAAALRKIYAKTDKEFIILIDEWDCVMRERQESEEMQKQYLDFLRNLLKDQPYVALAYGFADVVFLPMPHSKKPALVVELKYGKTADTALQQIKDRHYTEVLEGYTGEILLVGINYDKENENKPHRCVIEKIN